MAGGAELLVACVLHVHAGRKCDYDASYVAKLQRGVAKHLPLPHRFVCLSNVKVPCERIPLQHNWPGWWSKLELFMLDEKVLYFDLDTAIVGDLTPLAAQEQFTVIACWPPNDLRRNGKLKGNGSGVMLIPRGAGEPVRNAIVADAHKVISGHRGDGEFIVPFADKSWHEALPGHLVSYKMHVQNAEAVPEGARVVCFHGHPRPHELPADNLMREYWN